MLVLAAPAGAATATMSTIRECPPKTGCYDTSAIRFDAAAGEVNDVTVTVEPGGEHRLHDAGAPVTAGGACRALDAHTVACPAGTQAVSLLVVLGDGDDRAATPSIGVVEGGDGDDAITAGAPRGGPGDDVLRGTSVADGGPGNDHLFGPGDAGPGDDVVEFTAEGVISLGPGRDVFVGSPGDDFVNDSDGERDRVNGGGGQDTLSYAGSPAGVVVDLAAASQAPGSDDVGAFERIVGTDHDDVLRGDAGPNILRGEGGDDRIAGRAGDDIVNGGRGADRLSGGDGDDRIVAADTVRDRVSCGRGRDGGRADRRDRRRGCERLRLHPRGRSREAALDR